LFQFNSFGQDKKIDSLLLALKKANHDTIRIRLRFDLGVATGNFRISYWDSLVADAKKMSLKKFEAGSLNNMGYIYDDLGDIPMALECYNKCLKIQEEIEHKIGISTTLNNLGQIYKKQGDISRALDCYHRSLMLQEEIGDKGGRAVSFNNIGHIYVIQGDIAKALDYYSKSLRINEQMGDKKGIASSLNNIGLIFKKQGNNRKALEFYNKSLLIRKIIGDKKGVATVLNNIGYMHGIQGDVVMALDCYNKSLEIYQDLGDKKGTAQSFNNIAGCMLEKGDLVEAEVFANRSIQLAKELGFTESIMYPAITLKSIFQKQNKYKQAFEMYELQIKMRDSINNQETQKAAVKKQVQYIYEKKELEMKVEQDKKDAIANEVLKQKEKERNYFIAGFGLVAVLALFILRGYKQKQKANAIILMQKELVDEKQKEIVSSINYAKRIQMALLPSEKYIDKSLNRLNKFNS
jgi:tetratricopeptide (TPR) repeat protein